MNFVRIKVSLAGIPMSARIAKYEGIGEAIQWAMNEAREPITSALEMDDDIDMSFSIKAATDEQVEAYRKEFPHAGI